MQRIAPEWIGTRQIRKDAGDMMLSRPDVGMDGGPSTVEWFVLNRSACFEDVRAKIAAIRDSVAALSPRDAYVETSHMFVWWAEALMQSSLATEHSPDPKAAVCR